MDILIPDLAPATRYRIQFRSKNKNGEVSQWSRALDFNTVVDIVPPKPVTNLTAEVKPKGSFLVQWEAPTEDANGAPLFDLKDYIVRVHSPSSPYTMDFATASTNFTFTFEMNYGAFVGAKPDVGFTVFARDNTNNISTGVTEFATNQPPGNVVGFDATGSVDSISFTWTPLVEEEDDISHYLIKQGLSAATITNSIYRGLSIPATWETIYEGLQHFSIVAVDLFGQTSPTPATDTATARSSITVDVTPPGVPTNVTTTPGLDTSEPSASRVFIDVAWTPPVDTDVQEYIIRYSTNIGQWSYLSVPAEDTTGVKTALARLNNLVAGQSYYIGVQSVDFRGNFSAFTNSQTYPQPTAADTIAPSTPAAPSIAANTMQMQVTHSVKKADNTTNLERDLHHLEVYASTSSSFVPSATNKIGDLVVSPPPLTGTPVSAIDTFPIPASAASGNAQTWYSRVIAVDNAGNKSAPSSTSSASVPLLASGNFQDLAVTNAKIADLSVSKVTAGTGTAYDWTIKTKLTMGDASTNGVMESFDYVAGGTTGWRIEKGAFTVNNGTINARALRLQDGQNLLHPAYADFEWAPSWYTGKLGVLNSATVSIYGTDFKYGVSPTAGQSVRMTWSGAGGSDRGFVLGPDLTSYNNAVDDTQTYIVSMFVKNLTTTPGTIRLSARSSPGDAFSNIVLDQTVPSSASGWTRLSGTFTPPAGATRSLFYIVSQNAAFDYIIDGVQMELKRTGEVIPSPWTPPSLTIVDGGDIRTGTIQSSYPADGVSGQPAWSINTAGNFQLGSGNVRGTLYVGPTGTPEANSKIRSAVYTPGSSGWQIDGNGSAEFNQVNVRGNVYATGGYFLNEIVMGNATTSAHYMKSFNYGSGTGWIIRADGYAEFNNVTVRGQIIGGSIVGAQFNTAYSGPRIGIAASATSTSPAYGRIEFSPANGEWVPADIRCGEGAADRYIQIWSPSYGGQRSHISVGGEGFGGGADIVLVAPGGTLYFSSAYNNFAAGNINFEGQIYGHPTTVASATANCFWSSAGQLAKFGSSQRYKAEIEDLTWDVNDLYQLRPRKWIAAPDMGDAGTPGYGFVAEEVAELFPPAGLTDEEGKIENYSDRAMIAGLMLMVQDLNKRVKQLEAKA